MNEMAFRVTSNDGTTIAYDRKGSGPAVVLVGGAQDDGAENAPLIPALAEHFTVLAVDLRGHGESARVAPFDPVTLAGDVAETAATASVARTPGIGENCRNAASGGRNLRKFAMVSSPLSEHQGIVIGPGDSLCPVVCNGDSRTTCHSDHPATLRTSPSTPMARNTFIALGCKATPAPISLSSAVAS